MLLLALDTATDSGSLALLKGEQVLGEVALPGAGSYLVHLLPSLDRLLRETGITLKEVSALCVSQGPGNFTGLRLGLATAQGLSLALGCPLVPVPTLEALAARHAGHPVPVAVLVDAKRREVYVGHYDCSHGRPMPLGPPERLPVSELVRRLVPPLLLSGPGLKCCRELHEPLPPGIELALEEPGWLLAPWVGRLGRERLLKGLKVKPQELTPLYLRPAI
uniref:tRNA (Adenosine(37)-N6)-threonylcarbamoyltransferase complex dimerization subunit type 1 TsaB n=1 Tax=Desulfobacca acetoxidans TaxID=60893 RepID=A0A7C5AMH3_9BACT